MTGLTHRQQRFVQEYLIDLNATQAAMRAGYSHRSAYQQGHCLLKNIEVQRLLNAERKESVLRVRIGKEKVIEEIARIAFAPVADRVKTQGDAAWVRPGDKLKALELLARHFQLFDSKHQEDHSEGKRIVQQRMLQYLEGALSLTK